MPSTLGIVSSHCNFVSPPRTTDDLYLTGFFTSTNVYDSGKYNFTLPKNAITQNTLLTRPPSNDIPMVFSGTSTSSTNINNSIFAITAAQNVRAEAYVYNLAGNRQNALFGTVQGGAQGWGVRVNNNSIVYEWNNLNGSITRTFTANTWHKVGIQKIGNQISLIFNNETVLVTTGTIPTTTITNFTVGRWPYGYVMSGTMTGVKVTIF